MGVGVGVPCVPHVKKKNMVGVNGRWWCAGCCVWWWYGLRAAVLWIVDDGALDGALVSLLVVMILSQSVV